MLLWILLSIGLALGVLVAVCIRATVRAERRARRNLYASLGYNDEMISLLMAHKGSVSVLLARTRQASLSGGPQPEFLRRVEGVQTVQRSFRFTPEPQETRPAGGEQPALAPMRREPPHGRDTA